MPPQETGINVSLTVRDFMNISSFHLQGNPDGVQTASPRPNGSGNNPSASGENTSLEGSGTTRRVDGDHVDQRSDMVGNHEPTV
jgi:hypothetical protein